MTDLREKQPEIRFVDLTMETSGAYVWEVEVNVWPYNSLKNEDVYSGIVYLKIKSETIDGALNVAKIYARAVSLCHDVWQTSIQKVCRGG